MQVCPACLSENPDGQSFCGHCGTRLETTEVREERKVISALFCDLVGSTALGERMDHEDVAHLLLGYQRLCRRTIESHGGVVEKFIGDAVVGIFGVPAAHEDDPERAVRAALRIAGDVEASGLPIQVRIGVNTGEALVRLGTRSDEGFAIGDTVNTAARLEAAAPVMGVAVGEATQAATSNVISFEALPPVKAKGKAEPVRAWRALAPIARVGARERDRSPFVGRDLELSTMIQSFDRARRRRSTEFVTLMAEPGLGKSRLVREFARYVDTRPELVTWREGRCLPYGEGISWWALGEIVKADAGILETDDQATISTKLERVITDPDQRTKAWMKDRLAPLVGLRTETAPPEQEEAFAAWSRFLEQLAVRGPAIVVIEDLHWADDGLISFLNAVAERTAGVPLVFVITARPELEDRHVAWPPGARSTVLSLAPLSDEDISALIAGTSEDDSPDIVQAALERAGGSPLFAEQLVAMLRHDALPIAAGVLAEGRIPPTVHALIAARIDALPAGPKRVLMVASVVGKTFWSGAVESLGGPADPEAALRELIRREFIRSVQPSTMAEEEEYVFWHALVRDVSYAELTRAERAEMHGSAALWIAEKSEQDLGDNAEIVVHHIDAAREMGAKAKELQDLYRVALVATSRTAMRTDSSRAIEVLQRAIDLFDDSDPVRLDLLHDLGKALVANGRFQETPDILESVLKDRVAAGDLGIAARVAIDLSNVLWQVGDRQRADDLIHQFDSLLPEGPSEAASELLASEAMNAVVDKDYARGEELSFDSIKIAEMLAIPPRGRALAALGLSQLGRGNAIGEKACRSAATIFFDQGYVRAGAGTLNNLADTIGPYEPLRALGLFEESILLAEQRGVDSEVWAGRAARLTLLSAVGRFDEVTEQSAPVLTWTKDHGDSFTRLDTLTALADVDIFRGANFVKGDEFLGLCLDFQHFSGVLRSGVLSYRKGDPVAAEAALLESVDRVGPLESFDVAELAVEVGLPDVARKLARRELSAIPWPRASQVAASGVIAEVDSDLVAAIDRFRSAAEAFRSMGLLPDQARALVRLGHALVTLGRADEGRERLTEARALWSAMRAQGRVAEIDDFLTDAARSR